MNASQKKAEVISEIMALQTTYGADSGMRQQLAADLQKLSLSALNQLATITKCVAHDNYNAGATADH